MRTLQQMAGLLLLTIAAAAASAQEACDRACLTGYVDSWFDGCVVPTT